MRRASRTATTAAFARAALSGRVCDDPLARRFLPAWLRALAWLVRFAPLLWLARWLIDRLERGVFIYIPCRTAYIDRAVREARDAGIDQVVVLGAGYDSRAWRLAGDGVRFYELDHPHTQQRKRALLDRVGGVPPAMAPVDFESDDLGAALGAVGFDRSRPALWIWEGVTMFLSPRAVRETLGELRELAAPESRLVVDFNIPRPRTLGCTAAGALGEPCRFAADPDKAAAQLGAAGFTAVDTAGPGELRDRFLSGRIARRHTRQPSFLMTAELRA
jgi:methyltransferase (TIGR00027 family)